MDPFEALGGFLRKKREEKNLSLDQVSESLCLRSGIIEEIEAGQAHKSIPFVYLSGYIRIYSRLLGCEEEIEPLFSKLKERKDEHPGREVVPKEVERRSLRSVRYLIYALVLSGLIAFLFAEKKIGEKKGAFNRETQIQAAWTPEATSLIEKRLVITCHERTWVSVIVDGTEKKEFMLNPKDVVVLNAKEGFDLLIGNAGGVKLFLNGKDLAFSGRSGEVKRLRLY